MNTESDVANAKARYEMTRSELDEVNEEFEFLKESYEKRSSKLTQDVIKAWSAYQSARIDAELAKKHAASAIEFIKASMEEQQ
jgi:outer membrane protein TolC